MIRAKTFSLIALFVLLCAGSALMPAAEQPLTKDDVRLLLIGGASAEKMIALIQQRGVDFQMTPDLAKKFHDDGAGDEVIEALQRAGQKAALAPGANAKKPEAASGDAAPRGQAAAPPAAGSNPPAAVVSPSGSAPSTGPSNAARPPASAPAAANAGHPGLSDPSPSQIQGIIREFAEKEKLFRAARDNYTYHQINKVETLDPDGNADGVYEQEWDILYDDSGKRIERVTYAPQSTLQRIMVTEQDLDAMRNIQPFVLSSDELPEYDIKYLGHVKVDEITAYVFSIRPKELKKGRQYFQGTVWVDDRDLQIVKSEGKNVPELKTKKGENLFPRFTTYREQIDGKFWFPTYTFADDKLYFSSGPVRIKEIIRYTDYKQFKSKVRIIGVAPEGQAGAPGSAPATNR
jgi:hypothetical protein